MIHDERVQFLNDRTPAEAKSYVLYWVQASPRVRYNHALQYAIRLANDRGEPVVACFGLTDDYPEANERTYTFLLQGLSDLDRNLADVGIKLVVRRGSPADVAVHYAKDASVVVCDRGYLRLQRQWRDDVADRCTCQVVQVETDVVVPVEVVSDKHEYAARTIRPKIHKHWETYFQELHQTAPEKSSIHLSVKGDFDVGDPDAAISRLKIDRNVKAVGSFVGGEDEAQRLFAEFLDNRLDGYDERRNLLSEYATSTMSMYLHYGHISPLDLAMAVRRAKAPKKDRDAYLEEMVVRRELSMNFAYFCQDYDRYDVLPDWAKKTLAEHRNDKRPAKYTRSQLEKGETDDPFWNAAQQEMVKTGFMHNYMRMYWGKRFLEWTETPEKAFAELLHLNNKYFLCGRDANSFANVAWVFGLHDRPWGPERKIFGKVRYMNAAGLQRKFDTDAYLKLVAGLA